MPLLEQEQRHLDQMSDPARREVAQRSLERHRREDRLAAGDSAPDVALVRPDVPYGKPVRPVGVARADGRPVVLCFGSYT